MADLTPLQKAQKILATKATIKSALQTKGQTPTEQLDTYDDDILNIKTISKDGIVIDGDSNLELDKSSVTSVTNNTENTSLDIVVDDAGDTLLEDGAGVEVSVGYDKVKSAAGITASKILAGQSILDVNGTATNDANATSNDLVENKTAYIKGEKVTGSIVDKRDVDFDVSVMGNVDTGTGIEIEVYGINDDTVISHGTVIRGELSNEDLIRYSGLDSIGEFLAAYHSFRGVEGTYTSDADATAANIDKGKTAYVNGEKITGTSEKVDTSDADATSGDMLNGKTAYVNGKQITGSIAIPNEGMISVVELNRNSHWIYFNSNDYASMVISSIDLGQDITDMEAEGRTSVFLKNGNSIELRVSPEEFIQAIIDNDVDKTEMNGFAYTAGLTPDKILAGNTILGVEGTASDLKGETITVDPSTSTQTITPSTGKNAITEVTVNPVTSSIDTHIVAGNIKDGVSILGVDGTFTHDATATEDDILVGKTAYVAGAKVTGTSTLAAEKAALEDQIESLRQELADITDADDAEAEMQTIINNLQDEITQLKTDKASLEGQVTTLTEEKEELQEQLDDLEAVLDDIIGESSEPEDAEEAFNILNEVLDTEDTYDGMGGTEEEILDIMNNILGE